MVATTSELIRLQSLLATIGVYQTNAMKLLCDS